MLKNQSSWTRNRWISNYTKRKHLSKHSIVFNQTSIRRDKESKRLWWKDEKSRQERTNTRSNEKTKLADWYESELTYDKYEERYDDEWFVKLTETYNKMLDKLTEIEEVEPCCDDCANNEIAEEKMNTFGEFAKRNANQI